MAPKSAMSRKWRAGALHAGRAAAFLTIVTGVNSVLAVMVPRYEPIYAYLIAVIVVAWLSSAVLGVTAAVAAAILYDWMFAPVRIVPTMSFAIPLTIAVAAAIATRAARLPLRERPVLAEPVPQAQLLPAADEPPRVDVVTDDTRVREMEGQVALLRRQLAESRIRADDDERERADERVAAQLRESQLANDVEKLRQQIVEHTGRFELARREADALAQRLTESEARANEERARADRESQIRAQLEIAAHETLQKALAEAKQRADAAVKRAEALQKAVTNERARADRQSGEYAAAIAERQKQNEAAVEKAATLQREIDRTLASLNQEHARADREAQLRAQLEAAARETLNRTAVVSSAHQRDATEAREAVRAAEERVRQMQLEIEQVRTSAEQEIVAAKRALEEEGLRVTFEAAARQRLADEAASARRELDAARADAEAARKDMLALLSERDASSGQLRDAIARAEGLQQKIEEERERAARLEFEWSARLDSQRDDLNREFDAKLQKIVRGLAEDHENAIGDALLERETARAELRRATQRMQELERTAEEQRTRANEEKTARERLDAEWNAKLQKIVAHLTEDHESDIGEAMLQREAARAEVRDLTARLGAAQKQIEEDREKFRQFMTRRTTSTLEERLPTLEKNRPNVVLVVHSDAGVRAMVKHTLQQDGYIVLTAADGLEGLRTAAQQKPDVVLAEPVMPKMNARELVQLLKSKRETADVKVVLMSSNGEAGRGADFTADEIVRNPADFNELRTTLASLLARGVRT